MILYRSGCDHLEIFLRDLAYLLTSHGIVVKAPFLEQSQIDYHGGIASYLQRGIESSDYILIMLTENTKGIS